MPDHVSPQVRTEERRSAPRYPVSTRLFASIDGRTVVLRNISLRGVAVQAGGLSAGSTHLLELHLERNLVSIAMQVIETSDEHLLHARFIDLDSGAKALLNQYIANFL